MLLDAQNLFSDNQLINDTNVISENTVKFGKGDVSFCPLLIQVTKTFSNLTNLTVTIQTSSTSDFTESVDLIGTTLALADLVEGKVLPIPYLPKGNLGYIRIKYTSTGTKETTGAITAGVTTGVDISYQDL